MLLTDALSPVTTRADAVKELRKRVQAEYVEMPGLSITLFAGAASVGGRPAHMRARAQGVARAPRSEDDQEGQFVRART